MTREQERLKERLKSGRAGNDDDESDFTVTPTVAQGRRQWTYSDALKKRGMKRESEEYRDAITTAMLWIRLNRPFYGFVIDEMSQQVTTTTATAHVTVDSSGITMALNPDFMAVLPMRHRAGVIMHECIHVMGLHLTRIKESVEKHGQWVKRIANAAADIAVNDMLADHRDLPKCALMSNKFFIPDPKEPESRWKCFPARRTYEEYVQLFKSIGEKELNRQMMKIPGLIEPDGGWQDDDDTIDDHEVWLSSEDGIDPELLNEIIRDRIRTANMRAQARGVGAGNLQDLVNALIANKSVDFGALFQGVIGRHIAQVRRPSMLRPSKRYGQPPGRVTSRKLEVRLYQDTSGSMSIEEITLGFSEAAHAEESGLAHVTVQQFDWDLQGEPITVRDMGRVKIGVKGRGGTRVAGVMEDIDRHQPDLAIIATDGGLEHDVKPKSGVPVVWLLTARGINPGWGQVIRLPTLAEILAGQKAKAVKAGA